MLMRLITNLNLFDLISSGSLSKLFTTFASDCHEDEDTNPKIEMFGKIKCILRYRVTSFSIQELLLSQTTSELEFIFKLSISKFGQNILFRYIVYGAQ